MEPAPIPAFESQRIRSLQALDVLDTPAEDRFDRITRMAKALFDVPIALVSIVDEDRQWFKSKQGLTVCSTDRAISFCGHAIVKDDVFWIEDASLDPRFHDNPLVEGEPHIRFYGGYPLASRFGHQVGTLCVIDTKPRPRTVREVGLLEDLGRMVESELNAWQLGASPLEMPRANQPVRRERLDPVTGCWESGAMRELLGHALELCEQTEQDATVTLCEVTGPALLDDRWKQGFGDQLMAEMAQLLRIESGTYDPIGRIGSETFLILWIGCDESRAVDRVERLCARAAEHPALHEAQIHLRVGHAVHQAGSGEPNPEALLQTASTSIRPAERLAG